MGNQFGQTDASGKSLYSSLAQQKAGGSNAAVTPGGVLNLQTASSGNAADSTDDTLHTYTLPANVLGASGAKRLRVRMSGTTASNANTKTGKVWFGSASFTFGSGSTLANNKSWYAEADIDYVGVGSQNVTVRSSWGGSEQTPVVSTATQDETGSIVIKDTGASSASSASDVVGKTFSVEVLN